MTENEKAPDRVFISYDEVVEIHNAARTLARRVLPDGPAVAQFSKLIQWSKPPARLFNLKADNIRRAHAPDPEALSQEGSKILMRDPIGQGLELNALGREIAHEDETKANGLSKPPMITPAMLPKKLEGDRKTDNHEGVAELRADLGIAFEWPAEPKPAE